MSLSFLSLSLLHTTSRKTDLTHISLPFSYFLSTMSWCGNPFVYWRFPFVIAITCALDRTSRFDKCPRGRDRRWVLGFYMNRGQGRNTIVPTDRHVSGTNLIYDIYFQIYMYILYKALLISKYVADVFSRLRQRRFLAFEETVVEIGRYSGGWPKRRRV